MSVYLLDRISNSIFQVPLSVQITDGIMPIPNYISPSPPSSSSAAAIHYASSFCSIEEQYSSFVFSSLSSL